MPSTSKTKGSNFEREVAKLLNEVMGTEEFGRAPGSGAHFGGRNRARVAASHAVETLTGDLTTPLDFPFSIECKCYGAANGPNPYNLIGGMRDSVLEKWLDQAVGDAERKGKLPMVVFRLTPKKGTWVVLPGLYGADIPATRYEYKGKPMFIFDISFLKSVLPFAT